MRHLWWHGSCRCPNWNPLGPNSTAEVSYFRDCNLSAQDFKPSWSPKHTWSWLWYCYGILEWRLWYYYDCVKIVALLWLCQDCGIIMIVSRYWYYYDCIKIMVLWLCQDFGIIKVLWWCRDVGMIMIVSRLWYYYDCIKIMVLWLCLDYGIIGIVSHLWGIVTVSRLWHYEVRAQSQWNTNSVQPVGQWRQGLMSLPHMGIGPVHKNSHQNWEQCVHASSKTPGMPYLIDGG